MKYSHFPVQNIERKIFTKGMLRNNRAFSNATGGEYISE